MQNLIAANRLSAPTIGRIWKVVRHNLLLPSFVGLLL